MIYAKIYTGPGVMTVNTVGEERLPWLPAAQALKSSRVTWERPCVAVSGGGDPNQFQELVELQWDCFSCVFVYMLGAWGVGGGFHQSTALFSATKHNRLHQYGSWSMM